MARSEDQFLEALRRSLAPLKPEEARVYGSFLKEGLKARDIDLVVVSRCFSAVFFQERPAMCALPAGGPPFDFWPYTPEEWRAFYPEGSTLREEVLRGISVAR